MNIFKGQNLLEFSDRFKTNDDCKEYLAGIKWNDGFECRKCEHKKAQVRKDFSRTCNICSHHESATSNTLFHKVKFGVRKAFFIVFEMATSTKSLSASYVSVRFGVTEKTASLFMHKVREAMGRSDNNPMDGTIHVDEFVLGGREKKESNNDVELTEDEMVKRMYAMRIENFAAKPLQYIFVDHISRDAKITTDK